MKTFKISVPIPSWIEKTGSAAKSMSVTAVSETKSAVSKCLMYTAGLVYIAGKKLENK